MCSRIVDNFGDDNYLKSCFCISCKKVKMSFGPSWHNAVDMCMEAIRSICWDLGVCRQKRINSLWFINMCWTIYAGWI